MRYGWAVEQLLAMPGVTDNWQTDWNWHRFYVGDKFFCALCYAPDGQLVYITLKLPPEEGELLRAQYPDVIPGYYMNKVHWNSIRAEGAAPDEAVRAMLDHAWQAGFDALTKKKRQQIIGSADGR